MPEAPLDLRHIAVSAIIMLLGSVHEASDRSKCFAFRSEFGSFALIKLRKSLIYRLQAAQLRDFRPVKPVNTAPRFRDSRGAL